MTRLLGTAAAPAPPRPTAACVPLDGTAAAAAHHVATARWSWATTAPRGPPTRPASRSRVPRTRRVTSVASSRGVSSARRMWPRWASRCACQRTARVRRARRCWRRGTTVRAVSSAGTAVRRVCSTRAVDTAAVLVRRCTWVELVCAWGRGVGVGVGVACIGACVDGSCCVYSSVIRTSRGVLTGVGSSRVLVCVCFERVVTTLVRMWSRMTLCTRMPQMCVLPATLVVRTLPARAPVAAPWYGATERANHASRTPRAHRVWRHATLPVMATARAVSVPRQSTAVSCVLLAGSHCHNAWLLFTHSYGAG